MRELPEVAFLILASNNKKQDQKIAAFGSSYMKVFFSACAFRASAIWKIHNPGFFLP